MKSMFNGILVFVLVVSFALSPMASAATVKAAAVNPAATLLTLDLKQSNDQATWSPVLGTIGGGYTLTLDPAVPAPNFYYLDVASLTSDTQLKDGYYGFNLDETSVPADFWTYWAAKGVVAGATGWQGVMWQIINGDQPMIYLKVAGSSYSLVDGLGYLTGGADGPVRVSDDYPKGTYTFNGTLTDVGDQSAASAVKITFQPLVALTSLALESSTDLTTWTDVTGTIADGYTLAPDPSVTGGYYYLDV